MASTVSRSPHRGDSGASFVEYAGVIALVAAIALVLFASGIAERIAAGTQNTVAAILDGTGAETTAGGTPPRDGGQQYWNESNPDTGGNGQGNADPEPPVSHRGPPPGHPAGPPAEPYTGPDPADADPEVVEAVLDELEGCLDRWNADAPWFTGTCAYDLYSDLSPEEFAAVVAALSEEELGQLFASGPIPLEQEYFDLIEEIRRTASLDTIRRLRDSGVEMFAEPSLDRVNGDRASGASPNRVEYGQLDEYRLYGEDGQVSWEHVNQRALGDCWFMATLGAMAVQSPELVDEMIRENLNGTFTVTFPGREPITVTPDFPLDANGNLAFAGSLEHPPVIWPAVLEKAYAQLQGGDYANLENWHAGAAMDLFSEGFMQGYVPDFTDVDLDDLADRFDSGEAITFSTPPEIQWGGFPKDGTGKGDLVGRDGQPLIPGHVYFVIAVDAEADEVTLRNPWGPHTKDIVLSMDEVNDNFAAMHATRLG